MEQVTLSSRDLQTPSNHNRTAHLLNRLKLPVLPKYPMVKVLGNGVLGAAGLSRAPLAPGIEVARIDGVWQNSQHFGSRSQGELRRGATGCMSFATKCRVH
jgi:hypothetical protein